MSKNDLIQYFKASQEFVGAYTDLIENGRVKEVLSDIKNSDINEQLSRLTLFHLVSNAHLSLAASIKNQYVILTELQRFKVSNKDALKDIGIFEDFNEAFSILEKKFDSCLAKYEKASGNKFRDLLDSEGVPNGLPEGFCFHDIVRGLQEHGRIPNSACIPFIVHLCIHCFDMGSESFNKLSELQSIEVLEVKIFGEFIPSFEPVSKLQKLSHLSIGHCQASDLEPLIRLRNLKYIEFDRCNNLSDISPLAEISSLETVFFIDSKVSDYSPLADLENLILFSASDESDSAQAVHQNVAARRKAFGLMPSSKE